MAFPPKSSSKPPAKAPTKSKATPARARPRKPKPQAKAVTTNAAQGQTIPGRAPVPMMGAGMGGPTPPLGRFRGVGNTRF